MASGAKSPDAFKTIGELSAELGVAQHILRYWETRFPQLKPMQRAGNRRYYRPADVELVRRIDRLLNREGYTVRGVQQLLKNGTAPEPTPAPVSPVAEPKPSLDVDRLVVLRDKLAAALNA
ncbi:MerR family transcriptional regulator [Sphingomonas piscis]|uniref:MerR family transcriptional regulator n=1 Tax=Sphingomonas piscis TaxID=2714943 RepID=A0A6G7YQA6_9SPHN|nr:MerR family transcriptional regulator [Sphingomonas piscis]QIK78922.1 MerR family transcriptional regulator [Sphingomonas piscis]